MPPEQMEPTQLQISEKEAHDHPPTESRPQRIAWARLIQRLFGVDPLQCERCERTMRIVDVVMKAGAIRSILEARGIDSSLPSAHQARAPPQMELYFEKQRDAA